MADNSQFPDNSLATTRTIHSSFNTQVFSNSATDSSYSLDPTDTQDFFRLRLSRRSSVILTLNNMTANADLELLDSGGTLVSSYNAGTIADALTTEPLDAGDYYIRVFLPDTSVSTNYTLSVSTVSKSRSDLLWRNYATGENVVWQMNGANIGGVQYNAPVGDLNWKLEATADMDGDSIPDYIWRNYATGQNVVWLMDGNGGLRSPQYLIPVGDPNLKIAGVADFNGDGSPDILWRSYSTFENVVWIMNGTTFQGAVSLIPVFGSHMQIGAIADFNADNKPDIVWRNTNTGENVIWLMNGISFQSSASLPLAYPALSIAGTGDFNGDGKPDIVWRNYGTGENILWYMNGTALAGFTNLAPVGDLNWRIASVMTTSSRVDLAGNTMSSAFNIGTVGNATGFYSDTVGGNADKNDYYRFTINGLTTFNLSLTGLTANADIQLIRDLNNNGILDSQAEIVAVSANADTADEQFTNLSLTAGTYFIRVFSSSTQPTEYALNIGGVPAQQVDLAPPANSFSVRRTNGQALPTQVSLKSGDPNYLSTIRVYYSVRNTSVSYTPQEFRVSFYLSRDNIITTSDRLLGNIDPNTGFSDLDVVISNLAPNQTFTGFKDIPMLPATDLWWGGDQTYYIGMIIDSASQVSESNEINNAVAAAIGIKDTLRPDILGNGLSVTQTTATPGQAIRLTGSIRNIGNAATGSSRILVRYYFSNDDIIDGSDYVIALASIAPLNRRGTTGDTIAFDSNITNTSAPAYFTLTPKLPTAQQWDGWIGNGRYYVAMQIDIFGVVQEGSGGKENNSNYGRLIGSYIDYNFIDITGL